MPRLLSIMPLLAALFLGAAAQAQETGDGTTPGTGSPLSMGRAVAPEDITYIREEYDDWQIRCFRSGGDDDPCQMYQLLKESAGNPIAEFSLFRVANGQPAVAGATIIVPLVTLLTEELRVAVDDGPAKTYPFRFCTVAGCVSQLGLTQEDIDAFKAGSTANLIIVPAQAPDQRVDITVSLKGFTAAYENVSVFGN